MTTTAPAVTLHIENTVRDFAAWKDVFDRFERFRADHGVRSWRVHRASRQPEQPEQVSIDLDFDSHAEAAAFAEALRQIWGTPQSREHLVAHVEPRILDLVEARVIATG